MRNIITTETHNANNGEYKMHTEIETTQDKETGSGVYQDKSTSEFVLFHGITSKHYKTKKGALKAWNKLVSLGLV